MTAKYSHEVSVGSNRVDSITNKIDNHNDEQDDVINASQLKK